MPCDQVGLALKVFEEMWHLNDIYVCRVWSGGVGLEVVRGNAALHLYMCLSRVWSGGVGLQVV